MRVEIIQVKEKPLQHHILGLTYTATGYGGKLPTRYMVKNKGSGKWHRVYSVYYSNVSTEYILVGGVKIVVDLNSILNQK